MGAVKTAGRGNEPELSPWADQTVTVGRAAILDDCRSRLRREKDTLTDNEGDVEIQNVAIGVSIGNLMPTIQPTE